ncbi:cupredoxin domain-containing protein [Bacillus sp. m3-13]|uniref:cupredoxin domain-containing protein n=1 Tax=Bacillus sp. m3-13 TaxID=406124 RepID=UPI0001E8A041|nr:cupredoxin domain-containing protein [Bacillus sp. m3-13]
MKFFVIKKSFLITVVLCIIAGLGGWYVVNNGVVPTTGKPSEEENLVFNMITSEFKTKLDDGTEIEAYRFDPGTITVPKGKEITLSIFGVNGSEHPYSIEGTDINGVIKKGEETLINVSFDKAGVYKLICSTHSHHNGHHSPPMVAYIYVY